MVYFDVFDLVLERPGLVFLTHQLLSHLLEVSACVSQLDVLLLDDASDLKESLFIASDDTLSFLELATESLVFVLNCKEIVLETINFLQLVLDNLL